MPHPSRIMMTTRGLIDSSVRHSRWISFVFILGTVTYSYLVLVGSLAIRYTILQKHDILKALIQILVSTVLTLGLVSSFLVVVFKNPGVPLRRNRNDDDVERSVEVSDSERQLPLSHPPPHRRLHFQEENEEQEQEELELEQEQEHEVSAPLLSSSGPNSSPSKRILATDRFQQLGDDRLHHSLPSNIESRSNLWVKSSGQSRWCTKCQSPKPDRAHHCSTCNRCILRMDHHCPWIASRCIGLRTQKPFFLFLFYTCLFCIYSTQELARGLISYVDTEIDGFQTSSIHWAIVMFLGFVFSVSVIPFTGFHGYLICKNRTTIESMEGSGRIRIRSNQSMPTTIGSEEEDQQPASSSQSGYSPSDSYLTRDQRTLLKQAGQLNIYDIGIVNNWIQIMGSCWYLWFIPFQPHQNDSSKLDGYNYLVNIQTLNRLQHLTQSIWNPSHRIDQQVSNRNRENTTSTWDQQRYTGQVFHGGHGEMEWGEPPKKSEWGVLYPADDDDEQED